MKKQLLTLALALASTGIVMAQNATQSGPQNPAGNGMGAMMDPAERFKQLDKNNDGKLTQEEFISGMQQMRAGGQGGQGGPQGGAQGGTQGSAPNGGAGGPPSGGPPAGANGNGGMGGGMMMDPAERFKAMDKNSDGKVTKEEFIAAMQQMQQMRGSQQSSAPAAKTSK